MSRHVWIDKDAAVDLVKLRAHGITRAYFDARSAVQDEPTIYPSVIERGIYRAQNWTPGLGAAPLASLLSADVARWGGDPYKQLAVHANIELHEPSWIVSFLKVWRAIRPYRETALVIEGLQGGWFTGELRLWFQDNMRGVDVLAEAYTGDMGPLDADDVRSNLIDYGVARQRALVMYDAARLSLFWDGCAFLQGRLP